MSNEEAQEYTISLRELTGMERNEPALDRVALLKPGRVLDVGCGCGCYTAKLSPHCNQITAIDSSASLIGRCKSENQKPNVTYVCMDARNIAYPDASFDLVLERACLHHIREWEKVLDEMIRLSSRFILIEEPNHDSRSEAKRNTMRAQQLYLEVQNEVGYTHYQYIELASLIAYFERRNIKIETKAIKSDELVDFDQFFCSFGDFAGKSVRKEYWFDRLNQLRQELDGKKLCEEDIVFISAKK
ncbi:MAG: class I SAM-dependent methyltransferase [Candidatus Zixiibacteriota bacterium]